MTYTLLMLTHNRLTKLQFCLKSLAKTLDRADVELVILDNGSTDDEMTEWLRDWAKACTNKKQSVYVNWARSNLGVAGGRQELLKDAYGDVIIFLDSDVLVVDDKWINRLAPALKPESVGLVGPAGSFVTADFKQFTPAPAGPCDVVSGWCQAFKNEVLLSGIGLDKGYGNFWHEDSDFCLQVRDAGWDVACTGDIGVRHTAAMSGGRDNFDANMERFRKKWQAKRLIKAESGY